MTLAMGGVCDEPGEGDGLEAHGEVNILECSTTKTKCSLGKSFSLNY